MELKYNKRNKKLIFYNNDDIIAYFSSNNELVSLENLSYIEITFIQNVLSLELGNKI